MSPFRRVVVFAILLVALASGIWFIHNGGITSHERGITRELAFRGVACQGHAAWSHDLYGECHHETGTRH